LNTSARTELDRYLEKIEQRLPRFARRFLHWLRRPSLWPLRAVVALLLGVGGIFSFLPILGLWMLPLGLIIIAQDLPFLQAPLVRLFKWIEAKWPRRPPN
jgi:hypothetical protein